MRSSIQITQDQANELLSTLGDYPIPYKYSGIILLIQKWLAEKFNEDQDVKEECINAPLSYTVKE